jgi:hypothetical protein
MAPEQSLQLWIADCIVAGALHYHQVGQLQDGLRLTPVEKLIEGIPSQDQAQRPLTQFCAQRAEGIHHEGGAPALQFSIVDDETRLLGDGKPQHLQTQPPGNPRLLTMHGTMQWDETHLLQPDPLHHIQRGAQMAKVDGIEGASEDTDHPRIRSWTG